MKIGIFDSGIGGISVLYDALKILPKEDYIYYADTLNVPYGSKDKEEVRKYVFEAVDFIINKGVQAIVMACNTATSIAINDLRNKYDIPIIGMEPAVKPAFEKGRQLNKRILVTATPLTLKEEKLQNLISKLDNENVVDLLPLPGLVKLAESFKFTGEAVSLYLEEQLEKYQISNYDTVVLGCTHFTFFKDAFQKIFTEDINIIDGNLGTVKNLKYIIERNNILNKGTGNITYYNSGLIVEDTAILNQYDTLFKRLDSII